MIEKLNNWVQKIKIDLVAIYYASRDTRTPRAAKYIAIAVAAYALSPIDLIPDFIPILGYLDDLILIPAGIALVVRLIPTQLMSEFRDVAAQESYPRKNWFVGSVIIVLWTICGVLLGLWVYSIWPTWVLL